MPEDQTPAATGERSTSVATTTYGAHEEKAADDDFVEKGLGELTDFEPTTKTTATSSHSTYENGGMRSADAKDDAQIAAAAADEEEKHNPNIVDWDGPDDPQNPMNWTSSRKWLMIGLVSAVTFNTSLAPTIFAPGVSLAQQDFNDYNSAEASLLVSIFVIGLAIGPLFLSPASELYGRMLATHVSNIVFTIASVICAVAVDIPMLLVWRLIMGLACAVPLTIGGAVIADLIEREKRGTALSIWTVGPLLGPVIGPVAGGYLSMNVSWRWTYWLLVIIHGVLTVTCFVFFRETYAPRLMQLKTRRLQRDTGNIDLRSKFDKNLSARTLFRLALTRPAKMLIYSPIVLVLSLFMSVVYSYMYILFTTFTGIFQKGYGFNIGEAGLAYLGLGVGLLVGQILVGRFSDIYLRRQKAKNGEAKPEDRLPPLVLGSFLMPIGLFWYGWTAEYHVHWIVPIIGTSFCGLGILFVFMPVQLYLVDAYAVYAASALGCATVVRSIFGTCIPLAGPPLYNRLGVGWGNTLLGLIALAFAPTSFILLKYGERIRKNPKFQPDL